MWRSLLILSIFLGIGRGVPQSNYDIQGNNVEYEGNPKDLPPSATLAGKVTQLDTLATQIKLNRTQANLNCADGSMKVHLGFKEPFFGIAYSDFDRNSACYAQGTGNLLVTLELPLKGCGTRQDPQRVFTNNVIVRFHPGLEMEGDEIITIVCRYPPPVVVIPPIPAPILQPETVSAIPKPLREFEVLLIICAILFLGLMLLGLGCSYYCLKQRNIQVIRKRPFSQEDEGSDKLSTIESFSNLKIPRVQAPSLESSSDAPLEETLGSDYPSSIEDAPHRPDTVSSEYSDTHVQVETERILPAMAKKPQFDVNVRVAKQPEAYMQYSETEGSITSVEEGLARSTHIPDLHPPPRRRTPPTVFSKVQELREPMRSVQNTELIDTLTVVDRDEVARETRYTQPIAVRKPEVSVHTVDDVYLQTIVERRLIEDEERRTREVTQFYKKESPKWDVIIRSSGIPEDEAWERGSETTDVASSIGWSVVDEPPIRPHRYSTVDQDLMTRRTDVTRTEHESTTVSRAMQKLQEDDTRVWNEKWQVLLRVLESPPRETVESLDGDDTDRESVLTVDERERWRQIITTESTLRSLLTEATVREDFERIRRDTRYEKLFEPAKWDVIIRVLAPPVPEPDNDRFYSDTMSEVSTISGSSGPPNHSNHGGNYNYRKKSTDTTARSDVRSMTEVMVNLDHYVSRDFDDSSVVSSVPGPARSVADRSQTEIVEFAPLDEEEDSGTEREGSPDLLVASGGRGQGQSNNFRTQEHSVSRHVGENGAFVQETSTTRSTFASSSSRLTRH